MGSPTSRIISEIFLQNMENEHFHITRKHKIRLLARYVDDILVIYENDILNDLNSIHNKIKFTNENEINNTINYLDLTIAKNLQKKVIDLGIYHKQPATHQQSTISQDINSNKN
jgi:hypothetical protein